MIPDSLRLSTFLACAVAALAGCNGETADAAADTPSPAALPAAVERDPATPDGGLRDWVADIRTGIAGLGERVRTDSEAAEKTAVDLYVNRQEWLERYWGTYGSFTRDVAPALGQAVMDAEARFHELLILLAGAEPPPAEKVDSMVTVLDAQLARVLDEAERADVPLVPPPAAATTAPTDSVSR
jgi:hypothetical protein